MYLQASFRLPFRLTESTDLDDVPRTLQTQQFCCCNLLSLSFTLAVFHLGRSC